MQAGSPDGVVVFGATCCVPGALLWISTFIGIGTQGGVNPSSVWVSIIAATAALSGGFFALHARANAGGGTLDCLPWFFRVSAS
jgi:hypothetical protein